MTVFVICIGTWSESMTCGLFIERKFNGGFFHFADKGYPASYCFNNVVSIFVEILFIS